MRAGDIEALVEASHIAARLWRAMDLGRHDDVLAMFTPEARWFRDGAWQEGLDAVRASLDRRSVDRLVRHLVTNFIADHDGDAITCAYYLTVFHGAGPDMGKPHPAEPPYAIADMTMRIVRRDQALYIAEIGSVVKFLHQHA